MAWGFFAIFLCFGQSSLCFTVAIESTQIQSLCFCLFLKSDMPFSILYHVLNMNSAKDVGLLFLT